MRIMVLIMLWQIGQHLGLGPGYWVAWWAGVILWAFILPSAIAKKIGEKENE